MFSVIYVFRDMIKSFVCKRETNLNHSEHLKKLLEKVSSLFSWGGKIIMSVMNLLILQAKQNVGVEI